MSQITDYRIIIEWDDALGAAVQAAIDDGWQPMGAPTFSDNKRARQVLVKLEADTQPAEYTLPAATAAALGGVLLAASVADAAEGTILAQFNALLASLRTAGVLAPVEAP